MGNVSSVILGAGNRPRQGRAVLEILVLLWVLRRLGAGNDARKAKQAADEAKESSRATPTVPNSPALSSSGDSRRRSVSSSGSLLAKPAAPPTVSGVAAADGALARWNAWLRQYNPAQLILAVLIGVHVYHNLALLLGLNAPHHSITLEPDMHYSPNYQKVRWLLTSLDAATLSTLKVKWPPLRHALMLFLSGYYLLNFRRAENQVEAFRRSMTHTAIRACWEKGSTPVLAAVDKLTRPRCVLELEATPIRSPDGHDIECSLFYNKPRSELAKETRLLLDFPGGGFIAMSPQHHADYLSFWARTLDVPVLSVNYRKAPEFPFPCGFEDAWHVYKAVVDTNGGVIGLNTSSGSSAAPIKLAIAGDSAGGNLAAAVTIKAIQSGLRVADGLLLIYPCLDMASTNFWRESTLAPTDHVVRARPSLTPSQAQRRKTEAELKILAAKQTAEGALPSPTSGDAVLPASASARTELTLDTDEYAAPQLSSRAQYTQDGVLPLKYMQLIATCLFVHGGDPVSNPLISPAIVADELLARFPPIYGHVGSVDPLVDDVLRFGARLHQAKQATGGTGPSDSTPIQLAVIPGVSHAYMHVVSFLPEAKLAVDLSATWLARILDRPQPQDILSSLPQRMQQLRFQITDCSDYELKQPLSKAQKEAAAAQTAAASTTTGTPLVAKL